MEVEQALSQISEIHEHLARTQVSRAFRAIPAAAAGLIALAAMAFQPETAVTGPTPLWVAYWVGVAFVCGLVEGGDLTRRCLLNRSRVDRRHSRTVLGQFIPSLAAGAVITAIIARAAPEAIVYLPGLWAIIFGLGIFAARPFLPRAIGFVALYYFVAGSLMLTWATAGGHPERWGVGLTFGLGHLLTAFVLYWNLERKKNG